LIGGEDENELGEWNDLSLRIKIFQAEYEKYSNDQVEERKVVVFALA
jgi:hypothetical protein